MTTLEIPDIVDRTRRDKYGRYLVVAPGAKRPTGYTRATTVAKTFDGQGGLIPWKATAATVGTLRRPGLRAKWEALMAQHPTKGPWYGSEDSKEACKRLVEECAEAGGSSDPADLGDARHTIIELYNKGVTPDLVQPETVADFEAFRTAIRDAGFAIDPAYVESTVVLDKYKVAGKSDMLRVTVPGYADHVADLKTGQELKWSWHPNCIQLAIYAHGEAVYKQGDNPDGSQDERLAMPRLDQRRGLIIWLPAGQARCEIHWVDIEAGWEAFEHSMWARGWRERKELHSLYTPRTHKRAAKAPDLDEGADVAAAKVQAMQAAYAELASTTPQAHAWATQVMTQGNAGRQPWNKLTVHPTTRRYMLYRGVGLLAKWADLPAPDAATFSDAYDARAGELDEYVREIVAQVTGDETAKFPTNAPGMLLGTLDAAQATRFAAIAKQVADGHSLTGYDEAGGLRLIVGEGT